MPKRPDEFYRTHIEALLTKLVEHGWISEFGFHRDGQYALKWTPKGRERSGWVKLIESELELGPQGITALMVVCHLHGTDSQ